MSDNQFIALTIILGLFYSGLVFFIIIATNELRKIREKLEGRK
jgi:hypothetical protein